VSLKPSEVCKEFATKCLDYGARTVRVVFDAHLVEIPHVDQHLLGNNCLAPGMEPSNRSNPSPLLLVQNLQQLGHVARSKSRFRRERQISSKVADRLRHGEIYKKFQPRFGRG
jgi:hypothetical protein